MRKLYRRFKSWLRLKRWAKKNSWFKDPQTDFEKSMFLGAVFLHAKALEQGLQTNSEDYFGYIDAGMRKNFASYDWEKVDD